jgi:hypothetical protein
MFRQFKPKLAAAGDEVGRLITAAELSLADRGLPAPDCAWTGSETAAVTAPSVGIRTTVFEPGRLSAMAADAESSARSGQPAHAVAVAAGESTALRGLAAGAMLVWPWGASTPIDRLLRVGRDPEFSPFARQLWADPRISRRHAELEPAAQGVIVRDLGSSNGTYVGGHPVAYCGQMLLDQDVQLQFGTSLAVKLVFLPAKPQAPI